ncbi:hypothetical protein [Paenibacillus tundrae]|uniref:PAC domain-containing protein n=1 Tax=Paenibacillus tundrae TaxID=528187 RepID=A0ABT9WAV2_9BACL|nr:hypothetical protein [Paenibacillus tundrae]MDQ0170395.1 hypothetical protein [Paenibacillus tundrae]
MSYLTTDLEKLSYQFMRHQLIIVDNNWIIRSCNNAWRQGLGQTCNFTHLPAFFYSESGTLPYLNLLEVWTSPERDHQSNKTIQRLKNIRTPFDSNHTYDIAIRLPNSKQRWFRLELTPLPTTESPCSSELALIAHTDVTEQKQAEQQLQQALSEVRTLRGLLPICAVCKQIKDEQDTWNSVESYLRKHTHAEFTHDICPDCIRRLYPQYSGILG